MLSCSKVPSFREATAIIMLLALIVSPSRRGAVAFRNAPHSRAIVRQNPFGDASTKVSTAPTWIHGSSRLMSSPTKYSHDDYKSMTVSELRKLLKENGLKVSGIKAQLVDRLAAAKIDMGVVQENSKVEPNVSFDYGEERDELSGLVGELKGINGGTPNDAGSKPRKSRKSNVFTMKNSELFDSSEDDELAGLIGELKNMDRGNPVGMETSTKKSNELGNREIAINPPHPPVKETETSVLLDDDDDGEDDLTGLLSQLKKSEGGKPTPTSDIGDGRPHNLIFAKEGDDDDDDWDDVDDDDFDDDDDDDGDDNRNRDVDNKFVPKKTVGLPRYEEQGRREDSRTFREDFQGTRVFVQGLPQEATWKEVKDHFQIAGEVVYASVSIDRVTGRSKQCGIVQFETPAMAQEAIREMRNHPMNGEKLYVRKDVQESRQGGTKEWGEKRSRHGSDLPTEWKRANDAAVDGGGDDWYNLKDDELKEIEGLIEKRDKQRRQKNYKMSDKLRDMLKEEFGVHLDDSLKLWWTETEHGGVPAKVSELKGEGRWGKQKPWRQIPTTPESDAMVDSDLITDLLVKRDAARLRKDFVTADDLLRQAKDSPRGGLQLRISDDGRTWRAWTPERPPPSLVKRSDMPPGYEDLTPEEMCLKIVTENEPEKVEEIEALLRKFPGRERNVFKKLKDRYNSN